MLLISSRDLGTPIAYISTDQSNIDFASKLIAIQSNISFGKIKTGKLDDYEWQKLQSATDMLKNIPLDIQDGSLPLDMIEKKSKIFKYRGAKLIIIEKIDYLLDLYRYIHSDENNRMVMARLKNLSRLIRLPIILVADLPTPKNEYRRSNMHPSLNDLGVIYDFCDTIIFLHRDEHYGILEDENGSSKRGVADVIISKQYLGFTGKTNLKFDQLLNKFTSDNDMNDTTENLTQKLFENKPTSTIIDEEDIPF